MYEKLGEGYPRHRKQVKIYRQARERVEDNEIFNYNAFEKI